MHPKGRKHLCAVFRRKRNSLTKSIHSKLWSRNVWIKCRSEDIFSFFFFSLKITTNGIQRVVMYCDAPLADYSLCCHLGSERVCVRVHSSYDRIVNNVACARIIVNRITVFIAIFIWIYFSLSRSQCKTTYGSRYRNRNEENQWREIGEKLRLKNWKSIRFLCGWPQWLREKPQTEQCVTHKSAHTHARASAVTAFFLVALLIEFHMQLQIKPRIIIINKIVIRLTCLSFLHLTAKN